MPGKYFGATLQSRFLDSLIIVPFLVWFLAFYPGGYSVDSIAILQFVDGQIWTEMHTVFYQIFVFLTSAGGKVPSFTIFVQGILVCMSTLHLVRTLAPSSSRNRTRQLSAILMCLPYFGGIATVLWKDVVSSALLLLFCSMLIRLVKSKFAKLDKKLRFERKLMGVITLGCVAINFRHETVYIIMLTLIVYLASYLAAKSKMKFFQKNLLEFKFVSLVLLLVVIGGQISNIFVVKTLQAQQLPKETNYGVMASDLAYMAFHNRNPELMSYVSRYSTGDSFIGAGTCGNDVDFAYSSGFAPKAILDLNPPVIETWLRWIIKEPALYLQHRICNSYPFIPFPLIQDAGWPYFIHFGIELNGLNLDSTSPIESEVLKKGLVGFHNFVSKNFWPGLLLTLGLLALFLNRVYFGTSFRFFTIIIGSNFLVLFLTVSARDFRYAQVISMATLAILFVSINRIKIKRFW